MSGIITHPARAEGFANPWRVVAGAVAGLTICNGPVLFFTSGVFLKPIAVDMDWGRSAVSFALSLATLLSAVATPLLGRMMGSAHEMDKMPSSAFCRVFLGQRRGARRWESI